MQETYGLLTDEQDIVDYEKGLYDAFMVRTDGNWIKQQYKTVNGDRLQPNKSYSDLLIYGLKTNGNLMGAICVNLNMENIELERMGFDLSGIDKRRSCEILHTYVNEGVAGEQYVNKFSGYVFTEMKKNGYSYLYGSCLKELELMHRFIGFKPIASILLNGEEEILLEYNLRNRAW